MSADQYNSEIAFLNRKLPTAKIKWEKLPALAQVVSPPLADSEAQSFLSQFRDVLGKKAGSAFDKMFLTVSSKLRGGMRLVISITQLREVFADEIDGQGGGGGRGYNPLSTRPGRGSGGV